MLGVGKPSTLQGRIAGKPSTTDTSDVSVVPLIVGGAGVKNREHIMFNSQIIFYWYTVQNNQSNRRMLCFCVGNLLKEKCSVWYSGLLQHLTEKCPLKENSICAHPHG